MRFELSGSLIQPEPLVLTFHADQDLTISDYIDQGYTHFDAICVGAGGGKGGGLDNHDVGTIRSYGGRGGGGGFHRVRGLLSALLDPCKIRVGRQGFPGGEEGGPYAYMHEVLAAEPSLYWRLGEEVGSEKVEDISGDHYWGSVGSDITLGQTGALAYDPGAKAAGFIESANSYVRADDYEPFMPANRVENGDLSNGTTSWYQPTGVTRTVVTDDAKIGTHSLQVAVTPAAGNNAGVNNTTTIWCQCDPSKKFTVSYWVKARPGYGGMHVRTQLNVFNTGDTYLGSYSGVITAISETEWTKITETYTIAYAGAVKFNTWLNMTENAGTFTWLISGLRIEVGQVAHDFYENAARTFMGWAYRTSQADYDCLFMGKYNSLMISQGSGVIYFTPDWAHGDPVWDPAWPGLNQWVHWAITVNDLTRAWELFINGVSMGVKTAGASIRWSENGLFALGPTTEQTGGSPFPGKMQDVAIFEKILTGAEIAAIYASRLDEFCTASTDGGDGGYSSFNETTCRASGGQGGKRVQANSFTVSSEANGGDGGIGDRIIAGGGGTGGTAGTPTEAGPGTPGTDGEDGLFVLNIGEGGGGGAGGVGKYVQAPMAGVTCNAATKSGRGSYNSADMSVYGPGDSPTTDPDSYAASIVPGKASGAKAAPLNGLPTVFGRSDEDGVVILKLTIE
jgi:Concanavalin A-like lectin/glucanases superfamily